MKRYKDIIIVCGSDAVALQELVNKKTIALCQNLDMKARLMSY